MILHDVVGGLVNQPRVHRQLEHGVVVGVELQQCSGIHRPARRTTRHSARAQALERTDVVVRHQVLFALSLEALCALGGHPHHPAVLLPLEAGQHLGKAAITNLHVRHAVAQERRAVQQRRFKRSIAGFAHARLHVCLGVELLDGGELVHQTLAHLQPQVGFECVRTLLDGWHLLGAGHPLVGGSLVWRQRAHAGFDSGGRRGAAETNVGVGGVEVAVVAD